MRLALLLPAILLGATVMTQTAQAATSDPTTDPRIDPQVRAFLREINKDPSPFWELPQPKPQEILTGLQNKTPVDMSGVNKTEQTITHRPSPRMVKP
jgi:acetyl esterase